MKSIEKLLARTVDLTAPLSAICLGIGAGAVLLGAVDAAMGREARGRALWEGGTSALVLGCTLTACAAKGSQIRKRQWVINHR